MRWPEAGRAVARNGPCDGPKRAALSPLRGYGSARSGPHIWLHASEEKRRAETF